MFRNSKDHENDLPPGRYSLRHVLGSGEKYGLQGPKRQIFDFWAKGEHHFGNHRKSLLRSYASY